MKVDTKFMSDGDQGPLSTAGCLHAQAPSMHTYHTHVLLYAYVPHTFAPLCLPTTYVPHTCVVHLSAGLLHTMQRQENNMSSNGNLSTCLFYLYLLPS